MSNQPEVNLVLSSKRSRRDAEADPGVQSLRGRALPKMGDLAQRRRPTELLERMKKREHDQSAPVQAASTSGDIVSALKGGVDEAVYQPRTDETRHAYESLLTFVQQALGPQPRQTLVSGADEVLATLKDESQTDPQRQRALEELLGVQLGDQRFHALVEIGKAITDYHDEGGAGDDGLDVLIPVVFDGDEENEDRAHTYYIKDEEAEEEDDNDEEGVLQSVHIKQEPGVGHTQQRVLTEREVDAHWLQRQMSTFVEDAERSRALAEEVLLVLQEEDAVACENTLVQLLDYERFDLVQLLMKNRRAIVYATLSKRATSEQEREALRARFDPDAGVQPMELDAGDAPRQAHGDDVEPAQWAAARRMLDLKDLEFIEGSHLNSNTKLVLPPGTNRIPHKGYEEVQIPAQQVAAEERIDAVPVGRLPEWTHPVFGPSLKFFNQLQSAVFDKAFLAPDNLLIAAPTGSGKTNCAMLTMLHTIGLHRLPDGTVDLSAFKIVYIAPMKSLVQEMVLNFGQRLSALGITVRELSGDQNLNKQQINETQVIITTPEKWDIVTRRSGDRAYTQLVRLVIIDEVHLLHDERGPVLEAIVARTIRQIEDTQQMTRIVGLSATLPNYQDVAMFLRVPEECIFHFANAHRPVPLEMTFLGVNAKKAVQRLQALNKICYEQVMMRMGKRQVLVFVHSRKDTAKTARYLRDMALAEEKLADILADYGASAAILNSEAQNVRNKDLKDLLPFGFGIHHAGMARSDRTLVEDLFADGHVQILVCTATLAWGVNLPAGAVVIKGTQVYNPGKGAWVELSGLDVMQMLGRAGRPGYDTTGEGVLITSQQELQFYLSLMNQQLPIESQLIARLPDLLLAEVVLGTVTTTQEAVDWLAYTYLYICMLRNPTLYGIPVEESQSDAYLERRRADLVHTSCAALQKGGLITYDARAGAIQVTDIGRVAAHFYVSHETMATYNEHMKPSMSDIELLRVFSLSGEFTNISVRSEERVELEKLLERVPIPVKETVEDPSAKVNVLLQTYISGLRLDGFALMADIVYITQNAVRLLRALFEIAMKRGWAQLAHRSLELAQMTERRMWPVQTPLRQFGDALPAHVIQALERSDFAFERLWDLNSQEIGDLIRMPDQGKNVHRHVHLFPRLQVAAHVQPLTRGMLHVELTLTPDFVWSDRHHGRSIAFWVLIEDGDRENIMYSEYFLLKKKFAQLDDNDHILEMTVPMVEPPAPQYFVSVVADHWLAAETTLAISFRNLVPPAKFQPPTDLLDLRPLAIAAAFPDNTAYADLFSQGGAIQHFNAIQTQTFKACYASEGNVLVAASAGGGIDVCAELAMLRALEQGEAARVVYLCPVPQLLQLRKRQLSRRLQQFEVVELTGDSAQDLRLLGSARIVVTSPENFDKLSRRWKKRALVQQIALFVVDQLQMLDAVTEVCVSRLRHISSTRATPIRIVALSAPIANARDLGDWIGASKAHVFSFHSSVRVVPLEIRLQGFGNVDFAARVLSMTRPLMQLVARTPVDKSVLVFAHSVAQTAFLARELMALSEGERTAADDAPRFRLAPQEELARLAAKVVDDEARQLIVHYGIGVVHEHMSPEEQQLVQALYTAGCIGALVVTAAVCWSLDVRAFLVCIVGCQQYDGKEHRYVEYPLNDVLHMVGMAGRAGVDERGRVALYCNAPKKAFYKKFCFDALPVESQLDQYLHNTLNSEIVTRVVQTTQDAVDYLTWTFLYRRLSLNPNYYGMQGVSTQHLSEYLSQLVEDTINDLVECGQITQEGDRLSAVNYGMIAAYYYINYTTVELLSSSLSAKTRMKGLIEILAAASEFDEIPVRHGEPKLLRRLAAHLPMKINAANYGNGRTKINILLQAHFSRFALPRELAADQRRVVVTALRLIDAIVDVVSSEGWLAPALAAQELSQMLVHAMWDNDTQLLQVPHMTPDILERAKQAQVESIYDLMELEDEQKFAILKGLSHQQMLDVANACNRYPSIDVEIEVEDADELTTTDPVTLKVALERDLDDDEVVGEVLAPLFPGKRQEGWWLVVGDAANNLYGIKRVQLPEAQSQVSLEFMPPTEPGAHKLTVYLMCDSYVGCDQEFSVDVTLAEGVEESDE